MDENDKLDELYETLIIEKLLVPAMSPPFGGYNPKFPRWGWNWPVNGLDIEYRNKENQLHRIYGPAYK